MSDNGLKFKNYNEFKKFSDENDVQFVGLEFTDPRGKLQHTDQHISTCLLYTSPSPRDKRQSRMPSSA